MGTPSPSDDDGIPAGRRLGWMERLGLVGGSWRARGVPSRRGRLVCGGAPRVVRTRRRVRRRVGAAGWIRRCGVHEVRPRRRQRRWRRAQRIPRHARRWRRRRPNPRTKTLHRVRARRALGGDRAGARAGVRVVRSGDRLSTVRGSFGRGAVRVRRVRLRRECQGGAGLVRCDGGKTGDSGDALANVRGTRQSETLAADRGGGGTMRADGLRGQLGRVGERRRARGVLQGRRGRGVAIGHARQPAQRLEDSVRGVRNRRGRARGAPQCAGRVFGSRALRVGPSKTPLRVAGAEAGAESAEGAAAGSAAAVEPSDQPSSSRRGRRRGPRGNTGVGARLGGSNRPKIAT